MIREKYFDWRHLGVTHLGVVKSAIKCSKIRNVGLNSQNI